jgi:hypothetical protein
MIYTTSLVVSATVFGALVGSLAPSALSLERPIGRASAIVATFVCSLYALADLLRRPLPVPTGKWQVPQHWGRFPIKIHAAMFGAALGLGFATFVPFIGYYILIMLAMAIGQASVAAAAFALFGVMRALPVLTTAIFIQLADNPPGIALGALSDGLIQANRTSVRILRVVSLTSTAAFLFTALLDSS